MINDNEENPHRRIKPFGVEISYWRKNTACGAKDEWTRATVRAFKSGYWSELDCDTPNELSRVLALCEAVFSRGQEDKAKEIRNALNVPQRLT